MKKATDINLLAATVEEEIKEFGFSSVKTSKNENIPINGTLFIWKRKTWNTNRGIVLMDVSEGVNIDKKLIKNITAAMGKSIGYFPFFYPLGLQIILYQKDACSARDLLSSLVDKYDTQTIVVQSIFAVDPIKSEYFAVRTWGQYITGKFQDAIAKALDKKAFTCINDRK